MLKNNKKNAFTLIEIMFGILIVSAILIISFEVITKVSFGKIKLIDSSNIEKEAFFFAQRLYETIKKSGNIDYEEYWNRKVVNLGGSPLYQSGHYIKRTGFGNFGYDGQVGTTTYGDNFYYCRSKDGVNMGTGGCVGDFNDKDGKASSFDNQDYAGELQRYGEYSFQFIDYNSNADDDLGDEDNDSNHFIIGDDDDEYMGNGPEVFTSGTDVKELYLISADKIHRTLLRLSYYFDKSSPTGATCTTSDGGATYIGTGCLGKVEFLKLIGKDRGMDHDVASIDSDGTQYDGVVDTWLIDPDFTGGVEVIAGTDNKNYWLPLFSDNVNVKSFKIYPYPNKDINLAWKDNSAGTNVSPYVRIDLVLSPSWKIKKKLKGKVPEFKYSTTISLLDVYSR